MVKGIDWIAVDWGTSRLRVWAVGQDGAILAEAASDAGMGQLPRDGFERALLALVGPWLGDGVTPVIACGMVGSRQGWCEAPYRPIPCAPIANRALMQVLTADPRLTVWIIPGLSQKSPADVMRGEETQVAGFLAMERGFDGVVCLPGTHTKWVHVSANEVVSFQTLMTGELFELVSHHSVLRHGIGTGWDDAAFDTAVSETLARPERLAARLFAIRAEGLLQGLDPDVARARLSGLLIGAELAATKPYWLGQPIALIGAPEITAAYARALAAQGALVRSVPVTVATLAGLATARKSMLETQ